ncbi:RagB/SusD family nutrient uptake outer membrane protein [Longitalea arenae]|uniref:RagB/SusD family nutrient uptake outer membrane protein n=1 Tax=Longitalea arenae TaxID=2812558 RepID=UPI0019682F38|nr:RagB/SusD family nutrient uptake outer membrane protein [Longitalea arenae]
MKKSTYTYSSYATLLVVILFHFSSCQKYLDKKPDKKLSVISSVADLQSLMDNQSIHYLSEQSSDEISADNYYLTDERWSSMSNERNRRMYNWQPDFLFASGNGNEWGRAYNSIYYANTVIENIKNVTDQADPEQINDVKGQALFVRAKQHFHVAVLWANAYDPNTAATELGIPLRLGTDFNEPSTRSSLESNFDQIITDLKEAADLLPKVSMHVMRPSKPAAYGMLARVYLYMQQYENARRYADSCLQIKSQLLDYNTVNAASVTPFAPLGFNVEIIWENAAYRDVPVSGLTRGTIDTILYQSYDQNDLRKSIFFRAGSIGQVFKGNYDEVLGSSLFSGIATDEVYLMRAEAYARTNNKDSALKDLNTLMAKRWKNTAIFNPVTAADANEALNKILIERRKELLFRNLRWMDIKRLNATGANITLKRVINGQTYLLPPNDFRYALPIPEDIINVTQMPQNPR